MTAAPAVPKPAASVLLVRPAPPGEPGPLQVYMIRRNPGMKFLGGYYAFPGGKVDPADGAADAVARCRGLDTVTAEALLPPADGTPPLAYWVTVVRELLEETGVLLACDGDGHPVDAAAAADAIADVRRALMIDARPFAELLAAAGWYCDLAPLRYLAHFITPTSSPIRFSARFFLCPLPPGQAPRLFTEETSEGFWIQPAEGYRRFLANDMTMAEPAEYGLAYLAQFESLGALWAAHADGRHKFHGIIDRIDVFWKDFDWKANRFPGEPGPPRARVGRAPRNQ